MSTTDEHKTPRSPRKKLGASMSIRLPLETVDEIEAIVESHEIPISHSYVVRMLICAALKARKRESGVRAAS